MAGNSEQEVLTPEELHQRYEPEKPVHRAVNITYRRLQDRVEPVKHEEYGLWKGHDPVTGRTGSWWCERSTAVEMLAKSVSNEICMVNDCMAHLGEDSDRIHCDDCNPTERIECVEKDCEYFTHHSSTDYCLHHTRENGRVAKGEENAV